MTGTLQDLMHAAEQRARLEGYYSKGKDRELREQRISLCSSRHALLWRRRDVPNAKIICGVCHPPAIDPTLVEWIDERLVEHRR